MKNKTKEENIEHIKAVEKAHKEKEITKRIFPLLQDCKTIYDAQTTLGAVAGFLQEGVQEELHKIIANQVTLDTSKVESETIKKAMEDIFKEIENEPAYVTSQILNKISSIFTAHGADKFLQNPMSSLPIEEIINE